MAGEVLMNQNGIAVTFDAGELEGDHALTVANMSDELIVLEHAQAGDVHQKLGLVIEPQRSGRFWFHASLSDLVLDPTQLTVTLLRGGNPVNMTTRVQFARSEGGWWHVGRA